MNGQVCPPDSSPGQCSLSSRCRGLVCQHVAAFLWMAHGLIQRAQDSDAECSVARKNGVGLLHADDPMHGEIGWEVVAAMVMISIKGNGNIMLVPPDRVHSI